MDIDEKLALLKKNAVELVTEAEIRQILEKKKKPVCYCGYEPSGELHIGHLVTLTKLLDFEKAGFRVKILLADWHAWLNKKGTEEQILKTAKMYEKAAKKLGFKDAEFILGSSFQKTPEYFDDVLKLSLHTTLNRGLRAMQEVARDIEHATISQVMYPIMQIADIKHLQVDVAQSGIEQRKIHMLAREIMGQIDYKVPSFVHTPLINSLTKPGTKMSSSEPNSMISVRDSASDVEAKIKRAFCEEGIVENNPVLEIAKLIIFPHTKKFDVKRPEKFGGNVSFASYEELEKAFAEKKLHPMDLKNAAGSYLVDILEPIRKAFK